MFNAVRLLMVEAGMSIASGSWKWEVDPLPSADVLIVKEHKYKAGLARIADVILTSERDWDEVATSWLRFKGFRADAEMVLFWQIWLDRWREEDAHQYCMAYELLLSDPAKAFADIFLCVPAKMEHAERAWPKLLEVRPPAKGYDPETMLFHNHITELVPE